MKKTLSLLLMLVLLISVFASCAKDSKTTDPAVESSPGDSSESVVSSPSSGGENNPDDDGSTSSSIFNLTEPAKSETKTHTPLKELPSSATLVGSDTLPPIDNQGGLGCCASNAITYLQYTNAVAQFKKHNGGLGNWSPSTDYAQCFSPKFTYQFAGASTSNVYNVLIDHGALKNGTDSFAKDSGGGSQSKIGGQLQKQTLRWIVDKGAGEEALQYRLLHYDQTFVTNNGLYTAPGKSGVAMTTSEAGRAMIQKIKEAIASGNVVVTGGYPSSWQTDRLSRSSGTLGKSGDYVITFATDDRSGGHQVCIVAYDDEIEMKANGITMKGAFLIANSWGKGWGKNGYMWIMYDALNSESEYEGFELPDSVAAKKQNRDWPLDQFCFVYWDSDITETKPQLYAEVELSVANRDSFSMELGRTDVFGQSETIVPYMFEYMGMHETYDAGGYLNPAGDVNGEAVNGFYTVSFGRLCGTMPADSTYEDYLWSIQISGSSSTPATLKSINLKNSAGETVATLSFGEGESLAGSSRTYVFDFCKDARKNLAVGKYSLQNAATGKYVVKSGAMGLKLGDAAKDAAALIFAVDSENNLYKVYRDDEKYVLDVSGTVTSGAELKFNLENPEDHFDTQNWKVSYNNDGTISIFITTAKGTNYALGEKDGALCLVKATELSDSIKWKVLPSNESTLTSVAKDGSKLTVSGTVKKGITSVKLALVDADGNVLSEKEAAVKDRAFSETLEFSGTGTKVVKVLDSASGNAAAAFYVLVG